MNGLKLEHLLLEPLEQRPVTTEPAMNHAQLWAQSLSLAAGLQARGIQRLAVYLEDAGLLAIAEGLPVLPVYLASSVRMRESHQESKPLIHLDPRHKLTQQFVELHNLLENA